MPSRNPRFEDVCSMTLRVKKYRKEHYFRKYKSWAFSKKNFIEFERRCSGLSDRRRFILVRDPETRCEFLISIDHFKKKIKSDRYLDPRTDKEFKPLQYEEQFFCPIEEFLVRKEGEFDFMPFKWENFQEYIPEDEKWGMNKTTNGQNTLA